MHDNNADQAGQPKTRNAFILINNVRDHCNQSDAKVRLMFILASYCDREGVCWPSNETLARRMRKKKRRIQKMLSELKADGEITILTTGAGRHTKRKISLERYMVTPGNADLNMHSTSACLNVHYVLHPNNHMEQPSECILLSESNSTHLKMNTQVSRKPAGVSFDLSGYSEKERQLIDIYHRLVWQKDKRWWPVDAYTDEVSKALALYEDAPEEFEDLCHNALKCGLRNPHGTDPYDFDTYVRIPKRRTLVRLIWENY